MTPTRTARQVPVESLPDEAMVFLLPSRFCLSDVLRDQAWGTFWRHGPGMGAGSGGMRLGTRQRPVPDG